MDIKVSFTAKFIKTDGGRADAGFKGKNAGDCVARSMAIALEIPYKQAYTELAQANKEAGGRKSARDGMHKKVYERVFKRHGWEWVSVKHPSGRKARPADLPSGRYIASQARHLVAVIDGKPHDMWDTSDRMVYGYYAKVGA